MYEFLHRVTPSAHAHLPPSILPTPQILHHLEGHPHVIRIKGVYEDRRHVHIVMELASGGELFERMSKKGRYSEMDAAAVFR